MRLRQAVLAARDIDRAKALLEGAGLRDPFVDPGVKEFDGHCPSAELRRRSAAHGWRRVRQPGAAGVMSTDPGAPVVSPRCGRRRSFAVCKGRVVRIELDVGIANVVID